jgi:hypothetical protein
MRSLYRGIEIEELGGVTDTLLTLATQASAVIQGKQQVDYARAQASSAQADAAQATGVAAERQRWIAASVTLGAAVFLAIIGFNYLRRTKKKSKK